MDVIQAVLGQRLPSVSNVRLDVPEVIGRIIQKAVSKTVSDRYQSMSGLRYDLVEVRRLLGTGDSAKLLNWEISTKDISPSFILPQIMVGRTEEHDTIVKVIDDAFKLHQSSQRLDKLGINQMPRLSADYSTGFDIALTAANASLEGDSGSSVLSTSDAASFDPKVHKVNTNKLGSPSDLQHNLIDIAGYGPPDSERNISEKRGSVALESVSVVGSIDSTGDGLKPSSNSVGSMIIHRNNINIRAKGRCEVIAISGAAGQGKTRLIRSVQVKARQRGYFASSKFDSTEKTPFGSVLTLLSHLFQQVFSESNIDPLFHEILTQQIAPVWPILHKVLSLPEFLLAPNRSVPTPSHFNKLSTDYDKSPGAEFGRYNPSLTSSHSSLEGKTSGAQSSHDFLRAGSSTKFMPLTNIFLEILRIFTRHKFICFCLDDLHLADEESLELIEKIISTRMNMVIIVAYRPEVVASETMRHILDPPTSRGIFSLCAPLY